MTFMEYVTQRGITLLPWQGAAAHAFLSRMVLYPTRVRGKTFLAELLLDYINEHGNDLPVTLVGNQAMNDWDATWKDGDIPTWFDKSAMAYTKSIGAYAERWNSIGLLENCKQFYGLFDHYGTVGRGHTRVLITQPYRKHDGAAKLLAHELGIHLARPREHGPWEPSTYYYEFHP